MIKKIFSLIAAVTISSYSFAQNVNKLIKQEYVTKVISTLAADNMRGRETFTPDIERAAQYIESEFKKIGLKPMKGDDGYRQNFTLTRVIPLKTTVALNGKTLSDDSSFAICTLPSMHWNNDSDVQVARIAAGQDFRTEYRKYVFSNKKTLVVVDPKFEAYFKLLSDRYTKPSIKPKNSGERQVVFVMGNYDDIKSVQVSYESKTEESPLFNVVGVLPGKTKPDEYVIFSGHYDHLGILAPVKGDSIANGADDDASGTTAVITLAKYFKKLHNNARTLIFVAFTAEEKGEYGSQHFAQTVEPDKVVAMFNIEMIGKPSKWGQSSAFITGYERSDFGKILQKNLEATDFKLYPDPYPSQDLFYRSDNASLARVGVPAHTISTDQIDVDKLYHTVGDEVSSLDMANITSTIRAIALSSRTIVNGTDTPTRVAKLER
ncbi:MAG TPA: M20/M25/M40 family metallo-hydrolase [Mucilaginibacter sp.]|nr:M20/M25/M40 family metallo-hydrolase [Mucilaginibacter sp.]